MRIALLVGVIAVAFLINLPFGRLRAGAKRFSWQWFAYIHVPIPFIFLLRVGSGFGYAVIPLLFVAAVAGQLLGGRAAA